MSTLSHQKARRTYNRIGALQDTQAFYEDRATGLICAQAEFPTAKSVFEFGCGTGRFAQLLFEEFLPAAARYRGIDISPRMVDLARGHLASYSGRAEVLLSDGGPPIDEATASYDRFVSNYVFDLLSPEDIQAVLAEAHRILSPDGLLCLSGLSGGTNVMSRLVADVARWIHAYHPALIGGCRPIDLRPYLSPTHWQVRHYAAVVAYGVPSAVIVAQRLDR